MGLFDTTIGALNRAMDLQLKRHTVLSSNLANADTPNFRARDVDFAGELAATLERGTAGGESRLQLTSPKHIDTNRPEGAHIVYDNSSAVGADGNNVDIDLATGKISEASRAYQSASNLLGIKLRLLRQIVSGRGGV